MFWKKLSGMVFLPWLFIGLLNSQSLVELANKEKARRAKLKGKNIKVVTNADLKNLKVEPSLVSTPIENSKPAPSKTKPSPKIKAKNISPPPKNTDSAKVASSDLAKLEEQWKKANDNVGRLTMTMNSVWQALYS